MQEAACERGAKACLKTPGSNANLQCSLHNHCGMQRESLMQRKVSYLKDSFFFFLPDRQHELAQKPYHSYVPLTQLSAITVTSTGGPKYKLYLSVSSKSIKEYPAPPGF